MSLHYAGKAFLVAGVILLVTSGTRITDASDGSTTGPGSTIVRQRVVRATVVPGWHAAATPGKSVAGEMALGVLFILLGLGIHTFVLRRKTCEKRVKVHGPSPKNKPEKNAPKQHWILWMNVRM